MGLARLPLLDLIFVYFGVGTCDFLKDSGDFGFKSACSGDLASSLDCGCGGSGKVLVQSPAVLCAHCQGTGAVKTLTCTTCGGRGSVYRPQQSTVSCPVCRGSGDDSSAPAMACLKCRGKGWILNR